MSSSVTRITVSELCEREGVPPSLLVQLVHYEIAHPLSGSTADDWVFDTVSAQWMQRAIHLQRELEIDWVAVATLIDLLRERDRLQRENEALRQRLGRFIAEEESGA